MPLNDTLVQVLVRYRAGQRRKHMKRHDAAAALLSPLVEEGAASGRSGRVPSGRAMTARLGAAALVAAVLTGAGASSAQAEEAPAKAGWDGSHYWFKDESGSWRWTSHYSTYVARTGGASAPAGRAEPAFPGRAGWDPVGRVYWYQDATGWWRWTSHQSKYEQNTGRQTTLDSSDTEVREAPETDPEPTSERAAEGLEVAIAFAEAQLGEPYVYGSEGPDVWDCSGLVQKAYRQAGVSLPRVAVDQYRAARPISRDQLRRGDLVFWTGDGSVSGIHHVAIYLGEGKYLEAPRPGRNVRVSSVGDYSPDLFARVG